VVEWRRWWLVVLVVVLVVIILGSGVLLLFGFSSVMIGRGLALDSREKGASTGSRRSG
jgi:hypothetical protein